MNTPDRQLDALCIKRLLPCKDVLIDAVNERAIEIKQERRFDAHGASLSLRALRPSAFAASDRLAHLEPLELRMPEIERLVIAGLVVRRPKRL